MQSTNPDDRAEAAIRTILARPIKDFVAQCRGYEDRDEFNEKLSKTTIKSIYDIFLAWSNAKDLVMEGINGECRVACGARIVTYPHFKKTYRALFPNGESEEQLKALFNATATESIIEANQGRRKLKYLLLGRTSKYPKEWNNENELEAQVWQNMDPNWWYEAGAQYVRY